MEKSICDRYDESVFIEYERVISDENFVRDYETLIRGINPYTKRKIVKCGKLYYNLMDRFMIKTEYGNILFKDLEGICRFGYVEDTKRIDKKIDINIVWQAFIFYKIIL